MMKSSKWLLNNSEYQLHLRRNKRVKIKKHAKSFWNASKVAFVVEAEGSMGVCFKIIVLYCLENLMEGCSPWGHWGSDTTERLHFHFSLSCIGEGNGNPLQCSCLENPRDGRAWWAAVYGVAQSRHDWSDLAAAAASWYTCFRINTFNTYGIPNVPNTLLVSG